MRYIASDSGGKDSRAMVYKLIELGYPLDEVVYFNNGMDFDAIANAMKVDKKLFDKHNIKFTELKPQCEFLYTMFDKPVNVGKPNEHKGYSWCGGVCRWGTTEKNKTIDEYCEDGIQYVGIAGDEWQRLVGIFEFDKDKNGKPILDKNGCIQNFKQISNFNKRYPLVECSMSEKDCLQYCRDRGLNWLEDSIDLYDILDRVSCWCCANKNLKELKNYYLYLPKYWQKLKELQSRTNRPFKYNKYTVFDLEEKFKSEENNG
ncbi:MAG: phosphoadenosine phosphosulfate reductase [Christensenellales bacterium]